ncbi:uncharacterized protein LOC110985387 [Acanthaster planci]|uniref:Uncharacterized protein LOC110985387 n=1 Tax=Acanthaster planci TaxID=133434 RepID=A0A8B7ZFP9_ACAPL|nr:uncharacterized protein LOC110985387 [Acanthaster planci]
MVYKYTVRHGKPEDSGTILEFLKEHSKIEDFTAVALKHAEEDLRSHSFGDEAPFHFLVLETTGDGPGETAGPEVVGCIGYFLAYCSLKGRMLFLDELFVQAAHRGKSLGRMLLGKAAEVAIKNHCKGMNWLLGGANKNAAEFYGHLNCPNMTKQHGQRFVRIPRDSFEQLADTMPKTGSNIQFL